MNIIETIKTWKEPALKVLKFIKKYRDLIYMVILILGVIVISRQCTKMDSLNGEIDRQANNVKAMTEQITTYEDELGRANAEKHAYQLTQEELRDSINLLKKKNRDYVAYINANIGIRDTVTVETIITRDPDSKTDLGTISASKSETYGSSLRNISVSIPYSVTDNKLYTGNSTFNLDQNIFVEGWLERDTKTNETYMHLRTDYPNVTFNSGMGVVVESSKTYERSMRKTNGIGIAVGPNFNFGYDLMNKKFVPTIGVGVTIGYTWTPRWAQW